MIGHSSIGENMTQGGVSRGRDRGCWVSKVNNAAKIKNLFTKPKTESMYSIKLIKESFPKTLPR